MAAPQESFEPVRLPASLSVAEADRIAASIKPSWAETFGAPAATRSAYPSPAKVDLPQKEPRSKRPAASVEATPSRRPLAAEEPSLRVPTTAMPWGKIGAALGAILALGGIAWFVMSPDEQPAPKREVVPATAAPKVVATAAPVASAEPAPIEPAAAEPAAAEPAAAEPSAEPSAEPVASAAPEPVPEPKVEPKPEPPPVVAKPAPPPVSKPSPPPVAAKTTPPPPKAPPKPPPPKSGGSIVRDAPF